MSKIGYIRVSTEHQETARQQEIMCGYQVDRIFSEKLSGANTDRPQLRAMLDYVREGDTLYVESISRLGRSTKDLRLCEKISVKSKTVIKNDITGATVKSRSNFLQYTTDTVICQDTSAISLMEWSEAERNQADSRRLSRVCRGT